MPPDATEYRILRQTLATLINACMTFGEPALQLLAADAATTLQHTSEAEPAGWTQAEMDAYAGHPDAAVEF